MKCFFPPSISFPPSTKYNPIFALSQPLVIDPFGHFEPLLQTFLFDTQPTTPIMFTPIKPNTTLSTSKSHTSQAQKASSKMPTITGNSQKHSDSMDTHILPQHRWSTLYNNLDLPSLKPLQFVSATHNPDSLTTLFSPLNPTPPFVSLIVNW